MTKLVSYRPTGKKLSIKNISPTQAELSIYGEIGGYWEDSITLKSVSNALKDMPDTVNTINVRINSPGGDVFDGIGIYNLLKNSKKKIVVYVDGIAASIASIIALAGEERHIGTGAMFMVHKPLTFTYGNANDHMNMIERLDDVEEQLISIYKKSTNMDRTEIKSALDGKAGQDGTYFDVEQAISNGLATQEMEDDSYINMAACLKNAHWIKNKKDIIDNYNNARKVIDENIKSIEEFLAR